MKLMLALAAAVMATMSCGQKKEAQNEESSKTLVLYYSQTSNTKTVAQEIANKLGADMEEIVPVTPYNIIYVRKNVDFLFFVTTQHPMA